MTFAKRGKDTTTNGGKCTCSPECIYIKTDIYKEWRMQKVAPQKSLLIALCIILKKFGPIIQLPRGKTIHDTFLIFNYIMVNSNQRTQGQVHFL